MNDPNDSHVNRFRLPPVIRIVCLCVLLCAAVVLFALVSNQHYPLAEWLFFVEARYWLFSALFAAASLSTGLRVLKLILPEPPRLGEKLVFGFAFGVLVFTLGVFLGGLLGLFGQVFFYTWPVLMLAFGARQGWRDLRRARRHLGRFGARWWLPRGLVETLAALLLVVSLVAVYMQVMTPLNVGGDSYWYHLPIAEHYVATGAIRPFAEGWYLGAYPHLASILYTWAFQSPGELVDHVALSSHLEWVLFLATLAGVSALTRRLLGGIRTPYAAAAVFLFPGLFLYDSSLVTGADHILAFWAPALALALIRLGRRFEPREAVLVGALLGAAILTKYQASYYFVVTSLFVFVLTVRRRRIRPALAWGLACLAVASAHWLKNWIFYGDPFYPLLNKYFPAHPFHEGAADRMYWDAQFLLTGTFWEKVGKTLYALVNYSFVPHDWDFHGQRGIFGSLFTLLIPALFFLRGRLRLWLLIVGIHLGIVVWFVTTHQDRYLQALVPWMAACTAAMLVLAWRSGIWVRVAVSVLVCFQVVWGADVIFLRGHAMIGQSPLKLFVDQMAAGHEKRYADRRRLHGGSLQAVGARLPPHAKLLIHDRHDRLGALAATVQDSLCWQGAFDYMVLDTPDAAAELWHKTGSTHVMWWHDYGGPSPDDLAREAVFARTAQLWGTPAENVEDKRLSKVQDAPSDRTRSAAPTKIAWLGCDGDPALGLYTPRGLVARKAESALNQDQVRDAPLEAVAAANAVILRPSCGFLAKAVSDLPSQFVHMRKSGDVGVWVRR